jgi:ribosomal protein S10
VLSAETFEMSNPVRTISLAKPAHNTAEILKNVALLVFVDIYITFLII